MNSTSGHRYMVLAQLTHAYLYSTLNCRLLLIKYGQPYFFLQITCKIRQNYAFCKMLIFWFCTKKIKNLKNPHSCLGLGDKFKQFCLPFLHVSFGPHICTQMTYNDRTASGLCHHTQRPHPLQCHQERGNTIIRVNLNCLHKGTVCKIM
jgi:hypothetical protein